MKRVLFDPNTLANSIANAPQPEERSGSQETNDAEEKGVSDSRRKSLLNSGRGTSTSSRTLLGSG